MAHSFITNKDRLLSDIITGILPKWKSHATLTLLATQDCPLWLQYD